MALLSARRISSVVGPQGPQGAPGAPAATIASSAAWTPGLVASGAFVATTVTVTGVQLGQLAGAAFSLAVPNGVFFVATVTALSTITVVLINLSGSSQTLGAGTVTVKVFP